MKFEKISFELFKESYKNISSNGYCYSDFDINIKEMYDNIKLPKRSTVGSAGYDFYLPFSIKKLPIGSKNKNEKNYILIPTGIRCKLDSDKVLMMFPRSGLGTKYGFVPCNLTGIIDSDYYYSENEGHILMKMKSNKKSIFNLNSGDAFCQGIIMNYFTTEDDDTISIRNGGFGSTDNKNGE